MFKVLIVDQFSSFSPYWLQQNGQSFEELCKTVLESKQWTYREPVILEVEESFTPPFATTTFRAAPDGKAEVWKYRWDSSG